MKKMLSIIAITFLSCTAIRAQSTDTVPEKSKMTKDAERHSSESAAKGSTKYFYYPEANVYFNESTGNYSYYDPATSSWVSNTKLPSTYNINKNTPKSIIDYDGKDVWMENASHQKKYAPNAKPKN